MSKFNQMLSKNLQIAAIFAVVCICVYPAMGQHIPRSSPAKESQPQPEEQKVKIFSIMYGDAATIANVLGQTGIVDRASIDKRTNSIVLVGTQEQLETAESIIRRLDSRDLAKNTNSPSPNVRVIWLAEGAEGATAPAEDLKGVVDELRRLGLKNVGQVAQAVVRSQREGMFRISCSPLVENNQVRFAADGRILPEEGLQIHISVSTQRVEHNENLIDLQANTVFTPNNYIVLAVAPLGKITSVFVIQITEDK
jgi:hypothetical protein